MMGSWARDVMEKEDVENESGFGYSVVKEGTLYGREVARLSVSSSVCQVWGLFMRGVGYF